MLAGAYHGARPGAGLTFAELKPYEPGDDVRHLDWNVTARQNRPYVRRYVEERALVLWLIVDVSASLRFGPDGRTKADRAAQAAALLASAAISNGDRAGVVLVSDRIEAELHPSGGLRHLSRLLRTLVAAPVAARRTQLSAALREPAPAGPPRVDCRPQRFPRPRADPSLARSRPPSRRARAAAGRSPRRAAARCRPAGAGRNRGRRPPRRRFQLATAPGRV